MSEVSNQKWSRWLTSMNLSSLEKFSCLIYWTFLEEPRDLILSWKIKRIQKRKVTSHKKGSISARSSTISTSPLWSLLKQTAQQQSCWKRLFRISYFERWRYDIQGSFLETEIETTASNWTQWLSIFGQCEGTTKHVYLQQLLGWYNNKNVVPTLQAMRKIVDFHQKERLTCYVYTAKSAKYFSSQVN